MKVIHRLLFVFALVGIILGPFSIGAADSAMAASGPAAMGGMVGMEMPDDMPCCPEKNPIKSDCGKACPLALICTTTTAGQSANEHALSVNFTWVARQFPIRPHFEPASALVDPPVRPPRD